MPKINGKSLKCANGDTEKQQSKATISSISKITANTVPNRT